MFTRITDQLFLFPDTCNVYVLRSEGEAVLIDFGSGDVLDHLTDIGVERVTDALITHHHRDQAQGLGRAVQADIKIWVPHAEQDLFHSVEAHWQARPIFNNYNMRQDRYSLLESIPITGTLEDYQSYWFGAHFVTVLPTPGHTVGSIGLLAEIEGMQIFFSGDLIAGPGKVVSLSATQWSYYGAEGVAASIASLLDLQDRQIDVLLPSHGEPMADPRSAIALLIERYWELLQRRKENPRLFQWREQPYQLVLPIGAGADGRGTPHLLMNRTSVANSYVLLSESGKALFIDFGYDFMTGFAAGSDRASRRPWLYTLRTLKAQYGIQKIDVVVPTHYHDDHVAGFNLLRRVEGTQVWAAENFADILQNPSRYDLPCLCYDPIPVDRSLPLEQSIPWEEYTLTLHPLRGHTRYAVAIEFEVDGLRFLATGDQYHNGDGLGWNYIYHDGFSIGDYTDGAKLYQRICPDFILSGHWQPLKVTPEYLKKLLADAEILDRLHRELLPESLDLGAEGRIARILPYQVTLTEGETSSFEMELRNPFPNPADAFIQVIPPHGWNVEGGTQTLQISGTQQISFKVTPPPGLTIRRARLAVDVTIAGQRFGQQAEALVTVLPAQLMDRQIKLPADTTRFPAILAPGFDALINTIGLYKEPDKF